MILHIGADGGGTKTVVVAAQIGTTEPIAQYEGKSINYNFIGVENAAQNFAEAVKMLNLPPNAVLDAISIGDPSIDDGCKSPNTEKFSQRIKELLNINDNVKINFKSDAYMTLFGLTEGNPGAIIISGTGSMASAFDKDGNLKTYGGWGRIIGEEGGGYGVGMKGIRAALNFYDGVGESTLLLDELLQFYHVNHPREMIDVFYGDDEPNIAGFSLIVSNCAQKGDKIAQSILKETADYLVKLASSMIKDANLNNCKLGIYGSILVKDSFVNSDFKTRINELYSTVEIIVPDVKPEVGALLYNNKLNRGES